MPAGLSTHLSRRLLFESPDVETSSPICEVWVANVKDAAFSTSLLDAHEQERLTAFRQDVDRTRFLAGCALARLFLAEADGVEPADVVIDRTCFRCGQQHGKPHAPSSQWQYSISHAGDFISVAFCPGRQVGIDIEALSTPRSQTTWASVLTAGELACLHGVAPSRRDEAFLCYWTRKESVLKCLGVGLTVEPNRLEVAAPGEAPSVLSLPPELVGSAPVSLVGLDFLPGHVGTLAVTGPRPSVRAFNVQPVH